MKYPHILVLREKYGDSYYLMNERKDTFDFAIKLLTERYESGYFYTEPYPVPSTFEEYFENKFKMSLDTAKQLPDGVQLEGRAVDVAIKSTNRFYLCACEEINEYRKILNTVKNEDGKAAWQILSRRAGEGYEYESFYIERIENLNED